MTADSETLKVYTIPAENLGRLEAAFETANRKIALLNRRGYEFSPVSLTIVSTVRKPQEDGSPDLFYYRITVSGIAPRIAGWRFVATLQHAEGGTIMRRVPTDLLGEGDLNWYRDAAPVCEHCRTNRRRSDTFIVSNVTGDFRQIGRNCLAAFIGGKSPEVMAAYAEILVDVGEISEDCVRVGGQPRLIALAQYLPWVASAIRRDGWLSRSAVRDCAGKRATADVAWADGAFPSKDLPRAALLSVVSADTELADKALAFTTKLLDSKDFTTDYEHNLRVVCHSEFIDRRMTGIAASIIGFYESEMRRQIERQKAVAASSHVGSVGSREVFPGLVCTQIRSLPGEFGITHLHTFRDSAGNLLKWFASKEALDVGATYDLKATVKKHDEYQGVKQTLLSRCKCSLVSPAPIADEAG